MPDEQINLATPAVGARGRELVREVRDSGVLSLGPMGRRFESEFASWMGVDDAVSVANGTNGLHLAVRQMGWGGGDEVVTPPLTFVASANPTVYAAATR